MQKKDETPALTLVIVTNVKMFSTRCHRHRSMKQMKNYIVSSTSMSKLKLPDRFPCFIACVKLGLWKVPIHTKHLFEKRWKKEMLFGRFNLIIDDCEF